MSECKNKVIAGYRYSNGTPIEIRCGLYYGGEKLFCDDCRKKFEKLYPQGWVGYPGDVCKHGYYVGGIGADILCPHCENGE